MGEHAVVLGASVSGLLAARVLSEFYDRVTVVERDVLPDGDEHRRGVPQSRHVHALLASGSTAIEELFPGILDELAADGAAVLNELCDFWQVLNGQSLRRQSGEFTHRLLVYQSNRPFLEDHIRRRVRPMVTMLDGHDVVKLVADGQRITGVQVAPHGGGTGVDLAADLVIDATGRGSRTPAFLADLGYGRPREIGTRVRLAYASQLVRIPAPAPPSKMFLVGTAPGRPTGGAMALCENDTWLLTAAGIAGHEPPTDWDGLLAFTATWAPPPMMQALGRAEPVGEPARYRYAMTQRRRYDKMRRFPEGLVVIGDAVCSFNPAYGQGMSVSALEALALRRCLLEGPARLGPRFFAATVKIVDNVWQISTGADLAVPEVPGRRTPATRLAGWYTNRVIARCPSDLVVHEQFVRVTQLVDPATALFAPAILRRVLRPGRVQSASEAPSRSAAAT
ncbi:FAD-dependent oxidoreductase [Mycobacterium sp. MS1601]|uniref:FAD-dependent oxidoreductase n=1 Tax=Mycobacterium sp. MS1601 TaxID=1936029 RepID=UPI00178CB82C|nr:2-polyprenyl-6-methoxyphenol hydroxylase-like oxidoreductase [Mycobacterium sp. MS1601]